MNYFKNNKKYYRASFFTDVLYLIVIIYSINHQNSKMKSKKKAAVALKKNTKKPATSKHLILVDKTIATTKQKTHNTIEDHHQKGDIKRPVRVIKNLTPRNSLQANKQRGSVSPFSSNQRSSLSPKYPPKLSPSCKQPKEKVKKKSKSILAIEKQLQNKKNEQLNKQVKKRQCKPKQLTCQSEYQNLLMRRLDEKQITERSQQSQISSPKISKLQIKIAEDQEQPQAKKSSKTILKQLRQRIKENYRQKYPLLKQRQLKFLCSIVLIQRIWKQYKTKKFISAFLTPRAPFVPIISFDSHRDMNNSKLDISLTTQQQTLELIRKYHSFNPNNKKKVSIQRESQSTQLQTAKKVQIKFKLNELEISSELTPQREEKLIRFIDVFRDISLQRPNRHQQRSKCKLFTLQQSLSESCLMQKLYKKVFKDSRRNNLQLFNHKKDQKQLQRSIQLLKSIKTPEKIQFEQIIQVSQRFETQIHQSNPRQHKQLIIEKIDASVETQKIISVNRKQINSIKQLNSISDEVITMLLKELSQQVNDFYFKRKIVNRMRKHVDNLQVNTIKNFQNNNSQKLIIHRKGCMPGLQISNTYIREYLQGLTSHMFENYEIQTIQRYHTEYPLSILKIHRNYYEDVQLEFQDQLFGMPIISNILFYQYQIIYQEKFFLIPQQEKRYANFLQGLIKIHNLLLRDCLEELLNKKKLEKQTLPWDHILDPQSSSKERSYKRHIMERDLKKIIDKISDFSSFKLGQFNKRLDDYIEEQKFLKCFKDQCQDETEGWAISQDYLSSRLDLSISVEKDLMQQVINELLIIF